MASEAPTNNRTLPRIELDKHGEYSPILATHAGYSQGVGFTDPNKINARRTLLEIGSTVKRMLRVESPFGVFYESNKDGAYRNVNAQDPAANAQVLRQQLEFCKENLAALLIIFDSIDIEAVLDDVAEFIDLFNDDNFRSILNDRITLERNRSDGLVVHFDGEKIFGNSIGTKIAKTILLDAEDRYGHSIVLFMHLINMIESLMQDPDHDDVIYSTQLEYKKPDSDGGLRLGIDFVPHQVAKALLPYSVQDNPAVSPFLIRRSGYHSYINPHVTAEDIDAAFPDDRKMQAYLKSCLPGIRTISLDARRRIICLTGHNANGKTSTLKGLKYAIERGQAGLDVHGGIKFISSLVDRVYDDLDVEGSDRQYSKFQRQLIPIIRLLEEGTPSSLFLFDEILSGTDTTSRIALVIAIMEEAVRRKFRGIYSTHEPALMRLDEPNLVERLRSQQYHPADLSHPSITSNSGISNLRINARYNIERGKTDMDYGIHVAQKTGLPRDIIERAREVYEVLIAPIPANEDVDLLQGYVFPRGA